MNLVYSRTWHKLSWLIANQKLRPFWTAFFDW